MNDEKKRTPLIRSRKRKPSGIPEKSTVNFAFHESNFQLKRVLPAAVLILAALSLFFKIGLLDPLAKKTAAYRTFGESQLLLSQLNSQTAEYDQVEERYKRYSFDRTSDSESGLVSRSDVLALIEKYPAHAGTVVDFSVRDNVLTANLRGISLAQVREMLAGLEADPLVETVTVSTAVSADNDTGADVLITILLKGSKEANG